MKDEVNANGENDIDRVIVWERWEKWPPCRRVLYSLDVCGRSIGWGVDGSGEGYMDARGCKSASKAADLSRHIK